MRGAINKTTFGAVAGIIFFSLVVALCPIDLYANPKSRDKSGRQTKRVAAKETVKKQEAAPPSRTERPADGAASEEKSSGKTDGEAGTAGGPGDKEIGGFSLYDNYQAQEPEPESYTWLIFKTLMVIGLLVGGFYYFFRFVTRKVGVPVMGKDVAQILSIVPLGQNKYLQVLDLSGRVLVLGVTDANISYITEITEKDEIDRIRVLGSRTASAEPAPFQEFLVKRLGKFFSRKDEPESGAPGGRYGEELDRLAYLKRQRERLKRINGTDNEV